MYTGKLQTSSLHQARRAHNRSPPGMIRWWLATLALRGAPSCVQAQEAVLARRTAQWAVITAFLKVIGFPFVWPTKMLLMTARAAVDVVRAWVVGVEIAQ